MTEPDKASSDGSNISLSIKQEGNELVLNGSKWWSSGAGDDRCKIFIVMGLSDPNSKDRYKRQSMVLVPSDAKGLVVHRMLSVYGYDEYDACPSFGYCTEMLINAAVLLTDMDTSPLTTSASHFQILSSASDEATRSCKAALGLAE